MDEIGFIEKWSERFGSFWDYIETEHPTEPYQPVNGLSISKLLGPQSIIEFLHRYRQIKPSQSDTIGQLFR